MNTLKKIRNDTMSDKKSHIDKNTLSDDDIKKRKLEAKETYDQYIKGIEEDKRRGFAAVRDPDFGFIIVENAEIPDSVRQYFKDIRDKENEKEKEFEREKEIYKRERERQRNEDEREKERERYYKKD
jgi:hypothetical protein